jgi:hypothetical protein
MAGRLSRIAKRLDDLLARVRHRRAALASYRCKGLRTCGEVIEQIATVMDERDLDVVERVFRHAAQAHQKPRVKWHHTGELERDEGGDVVMERHMLDDVIGGLSRGWFALPSVGETLPRAFRESLDEPTGIVMIRCRSCRLPLGNTRRARCQVCPRCGDRLEFAALWSRDWVTNGLVGG